MPGIEQSLVERPPWVDAILANSTVRGQHARAAGGCRGRHIGFSMGSPVSVGELSGVNKLADGKPAWLFQG